MKTININGQDYTVEQLTEILETAKQQNPMLAVYRFHNTTEEEFNKLYENIPDHVKAFEQECMITNYYNKGEKPNWEDSNQRKYFAWFYLDDFRFDFSDSYYTFSVCSSRLCFLREEDLKEAVVKFLDIYKRSRNG